MKAMNRVLILAALTCFAFAVPAAAFDRGFNGTETSLSEELCEDILQSSIDTADGWEGFLTFGFDDKDCKQVCAAVKNTCDKAVSNREKCFKKQDRNQFNAEKGLCKLIDDKDAKELCEDSAEAEKKECKDEVNAAVSIERDDCEDLEDFCLNVSCPGILFDD